MRSFPKSRPGLMQRLCRLRLRRLALRSELGNKTSRAVPVFNSSERLRRRNPKAPKRRLTRLPQRWPSLPQGS